MKKHTKQFLLILLIAVLSGCAKESENPGTVSESSSKSITNKNDIEFIDDRIEKLPSIAIYHENLDKYILLDLNDTKNGFNFASAAASVSFSTPTETIQFVQAPNGTFYQVVSVDGSSGGGGGVVTAGNVTLNVEVVICFNSGDDFFGLDLFGVGSEFSGFSGAIGIAGNFSALMEMSESEIEELDPTEIFQGMVAYYVFDGTPDGSYNIIDFFDADPFDDSGLEGEGLAFLISFQDGGGIFFSTEGTLTFNGGSVGFNGTYWGVTDMLLGFGESLDSEYDLEYVEVDGFGTLNCQ